MIIDSTDRPWIFAISGITVAGILSYIAYVETAPSGPSGSSWPGLIYGIAGTAMMAFAGLLGMRKKLPTLHIGRVQTWMRGHVWLGLVSFVLILLHGGFSMGGGLTFVLMLLFGLIVLSGILGVILQQFMPRLITNQVTSEIIYEKADEVLRQLQQRAEQRIETLKPKADAEDKMQYGLVRDLYVSQIKPFLANPANPELVLARAQRTKPVFEHYGKLVPPASRPVIDDLQKIVEQRRDLAVQVRLHHLLHMWLLVHVPLSAAVLILTIVHAIVALRYT